MASTGARPDIGTMDHRRYPTLSRVNIEDVDQDQVLDGDLYVQDFGSWYGKSIFQSTLAETIQKEYLGHKAISIIEVLERVTAIYNRDAQEGDKCHTAPQQSGFDLYNHIYSTRRGLDDVEWVDFCQRLSSSISISCERLRRETIPELPALSITKPSRNAVAAVPKTRHSDGASSSSSSSSPSYLSSSSRHQPAVSSSTTTKWPPQTRQASQSLANPAAAPETAPSCIKCGLPTSRLKTKRSNRNGNALRPYYKCQPCNKFHCFADTRGNDPANPLCHCGVSSKRQLSGLEKRPPRQLHYVCRLGTCDYYDVDRSLSGESKDFDENVLERMRELNLV